MKRDFDLTLYLVATRGKRSDEEFLEVLREALSGGVTILQLREKTLSSKEFYNLACKVKGLCDEFNVAFIVNDRIDIALASNASGVHIGRTNDLPLSVARKILGEDKILGISTNQLYELDDIKGADYIGVGALFPTPTKENARVIGISGLEQITNKTTLPIVAIGGINSDIIPKLKDINISGVAVVRAILEAKNPKQAARELKEAFLKGRQKC